MINATVSCATLCALTTRHAVASRDVPGLLRDDATCWFCARPIIDVREETLYIIRRDTAKMVEPIFDYQFRLILIGDSTVGKSSLLKYFTDGKFAEVHIMHPHRSRTVLRADNTRMLIYARTDVPPRNCLRNILPLFTLRPIMRECHDPTRRTRGRVSDLKVRWFLANHAGPLRMSWRMFDDLIRLGEFRTSRYISDVVSGCIFNGPRNSLCPLSPRIG